MRPHLVQGSGVTAITPGQRVNCRCSCSLSPLRSQRPRCLRNGVDAHREVEASDEVWASSRTDLTRANREALVPCQE